MAVFQLLPPLSLYVHIPWCVRKCPYCDFNSHTHKGALPEGDYLDALIRDLELDLPRVWGRRVQTVFLGGGTPSLMSGETIDRLLSAIRARVPLAPDAEITLEANPGASDESRFREYRAAGVNRLSIGIQSFDHRALRALGRIHDEHDARRAVEGARAAGFDNINLDLMYGLPGQEPGDALRDIRTATAFSPEHLSVYQLTLEPNTPFYAQPPPLPDETAVAEMTDDIATILDASGFHQYEISAYARDSHESRHNRNYWEFGDYLGIGAGAHAKLSSPGGITRIAKRRQPADFIRHAGDAQAWAELREPLEARDTIFEFMLNALRLINGVPIKLFTERTGLPIDRIKDSLADARNRQLITNDHEHLKTTELGRRFLNDTVALFLPPAAEIDHGQAE